MAGSTPKTFPDFARGLTIDKLSAREMQNLSDVARASHELRVGAGLRRGAGGDVSVELPTVRGERMAVQYAAIVQADEMSSALAVARMIAVETVGYPQPQLVWASEPFACYPAPGTTFADLAANVVDDSEPPTNATVTFTVSRSTGELPLVSKMGGSSGGGTTMLFGVIWPGPEGGLDTTVTMRLVEHAAEGMYPYVLSQPPVNHTVECWPNTVTEDYDPFMWQDVAITRYATVLPIVRLGDIWHVMLLPRFATQRLDGPVRTTDCVMPGANMV